ncbi:MAG: diacylglycerol kinase family protein [Candidatus Omnitrophica bacterium]|nr:diacylglycerol kinase family protein [Candidatus Omnitrophota bacterium]MDD5352937.1 diacylglycerol kinase family protein [Candidatus Omnitrophota bacterium]MDD5550536.1 diacylglycerol kinase family protein [Candidatus Omnitrophota bacterium]
MHRRKLIRSFINAAKGLYYVCRNERNMIIHLGIAFIVIAMSFFLHLDKIEFLIVLVCIALVLTLETINTAFECMVDLFHGAKINSIVKMLKDIASAAVLLACIFSAIVGVWIFLPKLMLKWPMKIY